MQLNLYVRPPLVSDHLPCNRRPPILNTKTFPVKALQLELLENHHFHKATATTLWAWKFKDFPLCLTSCKRPLDAFSVGKRSLWLKVYSHARFIELRTAELQLSVKGVIFAQFAWLKFQEFKLELILHTYNSWQQLKPGRFYKFKIDVFVSLVVVFYFDCFM